MSGSSSMTRTRRVIRRPLRPPATRPETSQARGDGRAWRRSRSRIDFQRGRQCGRERPALGESTQPAVLGATQDAELDLDPAAGDQQVHAAFVEGDRCDKLVALGLVRLPDRQHRVRRGDETRCGLQMQAYPRLRFGRHLRQRGRIERVRAIGLVIDLVAGPLEPSHVGKVGQPAQRDLRLQENRQRVAEFLKVAGAGGMAADVARGRSAGRSPSPTRRATTG